MPVDFGFAFWSGCSGNEVGCDWASVLSGQCGLSIVIVSVMTVLGTNGEPPMISFRRECSTGVFILTCLSLSGSVFLYYIVGITFAIDGLLNSDGWFGPEHDFSRGTASVLWWYGWLSGALVPLFFSLIVSMLIVVSPSQSHWAGSIASGLLFFLLCSILVFGFRGLFDPMCWYFMGSSGLMMVAYGFLLFHFENLLLKYIFRWRGIGG